MVDLNGMDEKDQAIQLYSVFKKTVEKLFDEYDLSDIQIGQIILQVIDEFIEIEVDFESEIELDDEEDEE